MVVCYLFVAVLVGEEMKCTDKTMVWLPRRKKRSNLYNTYLNQILISPGFTLENFRIMNYGVEVTSTYLFNAGWF